MVIKRRIVKIRTVINTALRIPSRVNISVLSTGLVTEIETFKNKQIVKVKYNVANRFLNKI